jgi:hypothetical protein
VQLSALRDAILDVEANLPMPGERATTRYERAMDRLLTLLGATTGDYPCYADAVLDRRSRRRGETLAGLLTNYEDEATSYPLSPGEYVRAIERRAIVSWLAATPPGLTRRQRLIITRRLQGYTIAEIVAYCTVCAAKYGDSQLVASRHTVRHELAILLPRLASCPYIGLAELLAQLDYPTCTMHWL